MKRSCNRRRNRSFILDEVDHLTELELPKMYWMNKIALRSCTKLSSHCYTLPMQQLLVNPAGCSYLDKGIAYDVFCLCLFSKSEKTGIVWPMTGAINVAFQIGLPRNTETLSHLASGFTRCTNGELFCCVSAIDGWVCKTHKPHQSKVGDVMACIP
jgi:hypothetical protein